MRPYGKRAPPFDLCHALRPPNDDLPQVNIDFRAVYPKPPLTLRSFHKMGNMAAVSAYPPLGRYVVPVHPEKGRIILVRKRHHTPRGLYEVCAPFEILYDHPHRTGQQDSGEYEEERNDQQRCRHHAKGNPAAVP